MFLSHVLSPPAASVPSLPTNADDPILPEAFRRTLAQFASGVTVVTTLDGESRPHGVTATSFSSLSLEPPLVQWSLKRAAWSYPIFHSARGFAVNILAAGQEEVSKTFASPNIDRFGVTPHRRGPDGLPLIEGALAWIECSLAEVLPGGDHGIFIGRVLRTALFDRAPLVHWKGAYAGLALAAQA